MSAYVTNPLVFGAIFRASTGNRSGVLAAVPPTIPEEVRTFLARLRLLEGVPFSHLVPDAELLPVESIRFSYVDREWTDALVEGALSVGTITTTDREHLQASYRDIRDEVDAAERGVRSKPPDEGKAAANTITGFLLRSAAVSGWPGLHVRAYTQEVPDAEVLPETDGRRMRLLRLERLAPAVLLGLFDGVPAIVHIEEPRQGIQFGVDLDRSQPGTGALVPLRDANTAARLPGRTVNVPFRTNSPGVISVAALGRRIAAVPETHVVGGNDPSVTSAELAMQLLQFPYRQVFGPTGGTVGGAVVTFEDVFNPTIQVGTLRVWSGVRR
jgi:hypothetical protein